MGKDLEDQHGVQSLEIGISILKAISAGHRSMMLRDIAASAEMPASKVHRYMVSLMRTPVWWSKTRFPHATTSALSP